MVEFNVRTVNCSSFDSALARTLETATAGRHSRMAWITARSTIKAARSNSMSGSAIYFLRDFTGSTA